MSICRYFVCLLVILSFSNSACKKNDLSGNNTIASFDILAAENNSLQADIHGIISGDTIRFEIPIDTLGETFIPTLQIPAGARVVPANKEKTNFSTPVIYTVTASNGSIKQYVVICKPAKSFLLTHFSINGADCAYDDSTETYYFPVSGSGTFNHYTVRFDTTWVKSLSIGNLTVSTNSSVDFPLTVNQQVVLQTSDASGQKKSFSLQVTGLPMVSLTVGATIGNDDVPGSFSLVDPDYVQHQGTWFVQSAFNIHIRGNSARTYPKKAYAVKLTDAQGADLDQSLLGLREDNHWVLDAMYIDQGRMRNRLSTDLWNTMNNVPYFSKEPEALNGTRGYLAEVFLNNRYWGVYCLTEDLDRKQIKAKKDYGAMYKADDAANETQFLAASNYDNSVATWGGWEFEYPDLDDDRNPDWFFLANFVKFVSTSTDDDFKANIKGEAYVSNLTDYLIFINAIGGLDNTSKNAFLSFYDYRKDSAFFYSVWDLDATFGRDYDGDPYQASEFAFLGRNNNLFNRLLTLNPDHFVQNLQARWNDLKNNQLSKARVGEDIDHYKTQLLSTGAMDREMQRWGNIRQDISAEADYMKSWYSNHYDQLDSYISSLN